MITRIIRKKKGMSPVVTSILMVLVVVAAMTLVVSFSQTIIDSRNSQMGEKLCVEKVSFSSSQITVQIRNIGHGPLTLEQALVNEQLYTIDKVVLQDPEANQAGQATTVIIYGNFSEGTYRIGFISTLNKDLGNIEVNYS